MWFLSEFTIERILWVSSVSIFLVVVFSKVVIGSAIIGLNGLFSRRLSNMTMSFWSKLRVLTVCVDSSIVPELELRSRAPEQSQVWKCIQFVRSVWTVVGFIKGFDVWFPEVASVSGRAVEVVVRYRGLRGGSLITYDNQ